MNDPWLSDAIEQLPSPKGDLRDYLLYRGMTEPLIKDLGLKVWSPVPVPDSFSRTYGHQGKNLNDFIICPLHTPRGSLLGFEARSLKKDLVQYRLPNARWNPALIGLKQAMPKIWGGAKIWIVEGIFDYAALCRSVPSHEVVLATLRAAMTHRHIKFFTRFARGGISLVYDNDPTGRAAIQGTQEKKGILHRLRSNGVKMVVDFRYAGKDPGDVWLRGREQALLHVFK